MFTIRLAETQQDLDQAFELAYIIFKNAIENNDYYVDKMNIWYEDPTFAISNFILALDGTKIIGLIRGVPREFYINRNKVSVFGISSVCVDPKYRGKGVSNQLMIFANELAKSRDFILAMLFARRAVDYYYNKFDYFGVSSYSKLKINLNSNKSESILGLNFIDFKHETIDVYNNAFQFSYENYFLRAHRDIAYWKYISFILLHRKDLIFKTILYQETPIGYVLYSSSTIHEFALVDGFNQIEILTEFCKSFFTSDNLFIEAEINSAHKINNYLFNLDYTRSIRHCSYGGHMIKALSLGKVNDGICVSENFFSKFTNTVNSLKSYSEYTSNYNTNTCIDIPLFDQF